ncbi:C39 family peptidase [Limosilactobacillus vaginalis]|uniref:C39 family peptidase n=1 Tax=Limosilactobacillus vaginalis TaxID=1633 RepID=UPI0024BAE6AC|nr:C39 family peptidase [Limosilactobacillus vaginalis]
MKNNKLESAKHVAMSALAMTSCGFLLWLSQTDGQADDSNVASVQTTQREESGEQQVQATINDQKVVATDSQSNIDQNDHGNYANLDSAKLDDQGKLTASGWHATNESVNRPYHYIIAYDQTNHREISRQNITNQAVERPDVQRAHNVNGAAKSGFNVTFDLATALANTSNVQLVSRYTADPAGNNNSVDYWFAPITIDKNNYANLDTANVKDGQLELSGWNATNLASNKPYHYIIILDRTTGKEVARQLTDSVNRPDVAKAYPAIDGAGRSGFDVKFNAGLFNFNHQLQVLSRYSGSKDGNSDYVDYYFAPITNGNFANQGNLDSFNFDGKQLIVNGWHANDIAKFENNHFIIVYDNTANKQTGVIKVNNISRSDVAKAFPAITFAGQSGFSAKFDLSSLKLQGGHSYSVVSRYSTSNNGNGGNGQYTDYWFTPQVLNQHASYIDGMAMMENGLNISGWMASDYALDHPYAYVFVMNNGKEVARQRVELSQRSDVAKVYPRIFNSGMSGFNTLVKLNPAVLNGNLQVLLRFSSDRNGNGSYDDQYSHGYATNAGSFDKVEVTSSGIYVSGWHASNQSANKQYQWLIFLDQSGHELYRQQVLDFNRSRSDVNRVYPYILNSAKSGYQLGFNLPNNMQHKVVRIIHRLTDDKNGNGNYVDFYSGNVSINSGAQTSGNKTIYYGPMGNIVGVFNNAEVICQNPELPTGCEMTAVTMMLRYAGVNINKFQVAAETPRSSNGDYGFVGNPYSTSGWWVFPTGIAPVVNRHLGHSDILTGTSLQNIQQHLLNGHLVVVWMANMNGFINHAITLTGYNNGGFTYNNPWTGRKEAMSYGEFYSHWNADRQRALSY